MFLAAIAIFLLEEWGDIDYYVIYLRMFGSFKASFSNL